MPPPSAAPFVVVFDTCTQARYYGDVHEVLALPPGAAITYDYSRRLFARSAARLFDELAEDGARLPVPALLMYGEKRGFQKGAGEDPDEMLRWDDAHFVPTRSATIEAVQRVNQLDPEKDAFQFRLAMKGFIDPAQPAIEELVRALEAADSLPFGDEKTQYSWVSLLPDTLASQQQLLISDDQQRWTRVVDQLVTLPTQFHDDVFWRVKDITGASTRRGAATTTAVPLRDRSDNDRGTASRWHRDYRLYEGKTYTLTVETYVPTRHTPAVPGDTEIALLSHDDHDGLLKLPTNPKKFRPNDPAIKQNFAISTDFAVHPRYAGIQLETQSKSVSSSYPIGSLCTVTFDIRKQLARVIAGFILILGGVALGIVAAAVTASALVKSLLGVGAIILVLVGYYVWKRTVKIGPHGG